MKKNNWLKSNLESARNGYDSRPKWQQDIHNNHFNTGMQTTRKISRSKLLMELKHLEENIYRNGIDGGMATSEAIDDLHQFMKEHAHEIIEYMSDMYQELLNFKTEKNEQISSQTDYDFYK